MFAMVAGTRVVLVYLCFGCVALVFWVCCRRNERSCCDRDRSEAFWLYALKQVGKVSECVQLEVVSQVQEPSGDTAHTSLV